MSHESGPTAASSSQFAERSKREVLEAVIEFIGDFDIVKASGIDVSDGGICFEVEESLAFEMRFTAYGEVQSHRAHLAWLQRLREGGYRLGFEFVPPANDRECRASGD